ncbi:trypsin-like peptidase domain-containing protein [Candidatus Saccharibacteria bacterium]|nr:trypsin-like peptidase domain-containing protein [Candidatus Saccharibacteria bacterium]
MEDSSTNPFIPQESGVVRQKVYERQSPLGRFVKWSLIVTSVIAVIVGAGLFFVLPRTSVVDQAARVKLADILQPPDQTLKRVDVHSTVGFSLNYDNRIYESYAEVGNATAGTDESDAKSNGQTYENNELRFSRAYNYVRIRPSESVSSVRTLKPIPPQLEIFATVSEKELAKAAAIPENKNLSQLSLFVKIDEDKRLSRKVLDDSTVVTIDVAKPIATTVKGIDYQKVRYTTTNDNHRVSNVRYDDCYYTIQEKQPYAICVTGVRPTSVSVASMDESVFRSIVFEKSDSSDVGDASGVDVDLSESPLLTISPEYYKNAGSLKAIAKAQPSVVRIGTLYCADVSLKFQSGETAANLTDACTGSVSSGVFVSKDGYIATTGHALQLQKKALIDGYINFAQDQSSMLDRLQRVLDYLVSAQIILQSDADYLQVGASIGDQEALAKVENIASVIPDDFIVPINDDYAYAVQLSDQPIVVNHSDKDRAVFAYSDTVVKAKFKASDYDAEKSLQEVFESATPYSDVGLLKVEGSFPDVSMAPEQSVRTNDVLSTIGYPAYTDSSLSIDKIRNIPVVTNSVVEQVYDQEKEGEPLVQTDTPVLPGNDGAPVFDTEGRLVGFAVYGLSYCPDQACFANGTIRTIGELVGLLDHENISLSLGSSVAKSWNSGVDAFFAANYASSADSFKKAELGYVYNRWASPIQKEAAANIGSKYDTSFMNQFATALVVALVVSSIATALLIVASVVHKKRISSLQVGHYGAASTVPVSVPMPVVASTPQVSAQDNQVPVGQSTNNTIAPNPPSTQPDTQVSTPVSHDSGQMPSSQNEDPFYK